MAATVPGCKIEYAPGASADPRSYRVDCSKAARTLRGFRPQWTARKGAVELYETYKKVGLSLNDFEGPRFQRIAHFRKLLDEGILDSKLRVVPGR